MSKNYRSIGLLGLAVCVACVGAAHGWTSNSTDRSRGIPASYPSVGNGPLPDRRSDHYYRRTPKSAPSTGRLPVSRPTSQRTTTTSVQPPVQVILPEQLLALLDLAFQRQAEKQISKPLQQNATNMTAVATDEPAGAGSKNNQQSLLALALVRNLVLAVNQANQVNDYGVLWAQLTPEVRKTLSPEQLAVQLASLREQNFDLTDVLVVAPQLNSTTVVVDEVPVLLAQGSFVGMSRKVTFAGEFRRTGNRWLVQNFQIDVPPADQPAQ
ncbi:MAG: hypothetical protein ABJH63_18640 [Rhizobiaceae bacterium]